MRSKTSLKLVLGLAILAGTCNSVSAAVIDDLETARFKATEMTDPKTKQKVPVGTVETVDGKVGKAQKFSFIEGATGGYIARWINADAAWDKAAGISFWVKGDGSDSWGGIELVDGEKYDHRYAYCFPIKSTDWQKITVPWRELIPIMSSSPLNAEKGFAPSNIRNFWFGKRSYWAQFPAHSYAVDEISLEDKIDVDTKDYSPEKPGVARFLAKLKEGKPVTIVTMGDSLTSTAHWANQKKLWTTEFTKKLEATYKSKVTLINPAIGGTTLTQNLVLMPCWLKDTPQPDLVMVLFGYNDWDTGVRKDRHKEYLNLAVDRIRRMTGGSADVLLLTTCPAKDRWETFNELCQAECEVAKDKKTGFADTASAFHKAGSPEEALKKEYWAWDNTHLGSAGHDLVAQTVLTAIESEGLGDLKAAADAYWAKSEPIVQAPEGQVLLSSFEPGQEDSVANVGGEMVADHATSGKNALKLTSMEKDYASIMIQDGGGLRTLHENSRLLIDVFNPQDKEVTIASSARDDQSKDYNTRHNGEIKIKPGKSTIEFDYSKLARSGADSAPIDAKQITLINFFLSPHESGKPTVLFIDNVRAAK